jgi:hypothetical protein
MAISKPITRVEQYLAHISGMRVNVPEVPLTREEMYLAAWARKSGIEDTEMQGEPPLTLKDCIGEPFNGLVLYGKSTQVTTTGAQLFEPISNKLNLNGITITFDENGEKIVVSGTPERSQEIQISKPIQMQAGEKYVLTLDEVHYFENIWLQGNGVRFGWSGKNTANKVAITVPDSIAERTDCVMYASTSEGKAYNFTINHLMLNAGNTALPWEPYTGGKPSPSPDYPQEIQSAKGEVVVHGKNLFGGRFYYAMYAKGMLLIDKSQKDKEVKFPYQPETETRGICKVLKCQKGKTYVISVTNPNKNATIGMAEYENIENAYAHTNNVGFAVMTNKTKQLYTAKSDGILVCGIAGTWTDGKTTTHECTESELLQVEEASEATSYEPYHTPHTLTIPTPNGLPGIPVSSEGNYTDEQGQQWICDEVDLERGVYVQRIYTVDIAELEYSAGTILQTVKRIFYKISVPSTGVTNKGYCTRLTYSANYSADNPHFYINEERIVVFIPLDTTIKPKEYLVQYVLATPIETPLSETDIAAYRALTTYKGTTILESECYLKVKYSKLRK